MPYYPPAATGGSGLLPAVAFTSATEANPAYGGDMTVMKASRAADSFVAWSNPGDSYPRILIDAEGAMHFGDGSYDPYNASLAAFIQPHQGTYGGLIIAATDVLQLSSSTRISINNAQLEMGTTSIGKNIKFLHTNAGPVLKDSSGAYWLILVDTSGNLSTTPA